MEVLLGPPSFSIEVPPSMAFVRAQTVADNLTQETQKNTGSGFELSGSGSSLDEVSSGSSSSIGVPDDDSEDDGGEEIQSKLEGGLCSLDSLEDSLPIKRGLSTHFTGKSKSFANLSEVIQVEDLKKQENPFNKRRRILMASKWSRSKSSFYNWPNPKSMPLLALNEDDDEEEDDDNNVNTGRVRVRVRARDPSCSDDKEQESDEDEDEDEDGMRRRAPKLNDRDRKLYSFKSRSCFDLQEYEYD